MDLHCKSNLDYRLDLSDSSYFHLNIIANISLQDWESRTVRYRSYNTRILVASQEVRFWGTSSQPARTRSNYYEVLTKLEEVSQNLTSWEVARILSQQYRLLRLQYLSVLKTYKCIRTSIEVLLVCKITVWSRIASCNLNATLLPNLLSSRKSDK